MICISVKTAIITGIAIAALVIAAGLAIGFSRRLANTIRR